jgi:hypothetical protein
MKNEKNQMTLRMLDSDVAKEVKGLRDDRPKHDGPELDLEPKNLNTIQILTLSPNHSPR